MLFKRKIDFYLFIWFLGFFINRILWLLFYIQYNIVHKHLGYVCFPKNTFRETIFQTFLCLFVIRKVGQRKTLSGQRKTLSGQRKTLSSQRKIHSGQWKTLSSQFQSKKILTWFSGKCFPFSCVCFPRNHFPNFLVFVCQ